MTTISREIREAVAARAGRRCEYCRLPHRLQAGGFECDHILPAARGGLTTLGNLAYACPRCNDRKWAHVEASCPDKRASVGLTDSESQQLAALLRRYERHMLVRAQAAALLRERGHDVTRLVTP